MYVCKGKKKEKSKIYNFFLISLGKRRPLLLCAIEESTEGKNFGKKSYKFYFMFYVQKKNNRSTDRVGGSEFDDVNNFFVNLLSPDDEMSTTTTSTTTESRSRENKII